MPAETTAELKALTDEFFRAVSFEPGESPAYERIRDLFIDTGKLIRNSFELPEISSVDEFIASRREAFDSGALTSFEEVETAEITEVFGNVAHRFSTYEKRGTMSGEAISGAGLISTQFIRTPGGWRMTSMAWDDERPGLAIPDRYRPNELASIGAIRFGRSYYHYREAVDFFRDLVGLSVRETFENSYGSNGTIFAMPTAALTFEVVEAGEEISVDAYDALVLYFPDEDSQRRAVARLEAAGVEADADQHPYWAATGAITYRDPDGHEVVFAPFVYGHNEPPAGFQSGEHGFPAA